MNFKLGDRVKLKKGIPGTHLIKGIVGRISIIDNTNKIVFIDWEKNSFNWWVDMSNVEFINKAAHPATEMFKNLI